jgi:WD40 repeat protein
LELLNKRLMIKRKQIWPLLFVLLLGAALVTYWSASPDSGQTVALPHFGSALTVSPDGRVVAIGDFGGSISLMRSSDWTRTLEIQAHDEGIWSLAFSPDGRIIASCGYDERLRVWDVATGKQIMEETVGQLEFYCLDFSPDGKFLVAGGETLGKGGQVTLFDCASWQIVNEVNGLRSPVRNIAFSPDSSRIVAKIQDGPVEEWDLSLGTPINSMDHSASGYNVLQYSPDGKLLLLGDVTYQGGSVKKFLVALDARSGATVFTIPTIGHVAISSDGQLLAVASGESRGSIKGMWSGLGRLEVYGLPRGELIRSFKQSGYIESPAFIPNTQIVVATGGYPEGPGQIYIYDLTELPKNAPQ